MNGCDWSNVPKVLIGKTIVNLVHEGRLDSRDTIKLLLDDGDVAIISVFNGDLEECNGLRIDFESEKKWVKFESSAIVESLEFTADEAIIRFSAAAVSTFAFLDKCVGAAFFVDLERGRSLCVSDRVFVSGRYSESEFELNSIRIEGL